MRKPFVMILLGALAFGLLATSTAEAESDPPTPSDVEAPATTPTTESLSEMIRRVRPAVVGVSNGLNLWGTGFIFRTIDEGPDKGAAYIMTNFHVIDGMSDLRVLIEDTAFRQATVVSTDPRRDLAMLRICCSSEWTAVEFKDTDDMHPGDEVIAIGYAQPGLLGPYKFKPGRDIVHGAATITRGIISAFRYDQFMDAQLIQHDAPINGGNSGGPLLSRDGRVVGINTLSLVAVEIEGLHFAVLETTVQERIRLWDLGPSASFGPLAGSLPHELDDYSESFTPSFMATGDEFALRATFFNPYSGQQNLWSYGFRFGDGGDSDDSIMFFVVDSRGAWVVDTYRDGEFHTIREGLAPQLLTGRGQKNELDLWVDGPYAWVRVNGWKVVEVVDDLEFSVGAIDLGPDPSHAGEVRVITGFYVGSERRGAVTRYEDFAGLTYDHSR